MQHTQRLYSSHISTWRKMKLKFAIETLVNFRFYKGFQWTQTLVRFSLHPSKLDIRSMLHLVGNSICYRIHPSFVFPSFVHMVQNESKNLPFCKCSSGNEILSQFFSSPGHAGHTIEVVSGRQLNNLLNAPKVCIPTIFSHGEKWNQRSPLKSFGKPKIHRKVNGAGRKMPFSPWSSDAGDSPYFCVHCWHARQPGAKEKMKIGSAIPKIHVAKVAISIFSRSMTS